MSIDLLVTVLRVFCREDGGGGNPLGVVLEGAAVAEDDRQGIARMLGYAETVFVEDPAAGRIRIYTPEVELPLAGHPLIGTGWLLAREGYGAEALLTPAGRVELGHREDGRTAARLRPEWCPPFELVEHSSAAEVDALDPAPAGWRYEWAWVDERAGLIRARSFVAEAGVPEDEATGSAAVRLCAELGRAIEIHQGEGSIIGVRPAEQGSIELAGLVTPA